MKFQAHILQGCMMQSSVRMLHDDCGQHTRTNFELSESGENKLLQDEIQYQIDCLRIPNSSANSKVEAIKVLTRLFSGPISGILRKRLYDKIQEIFSLLSNAFDKGAQLGASFASRALQLMLLLCCDEEGGFDPTVTISKRLVSTILQERDFQTRKACCSCGTSTSPTKCATVVAQKEGLTRTATETSDTGHHRKRKFTGSGSLQNLRADTSASAGNSPAVTLKTSTVSQPPTSDRLSVLRATFWCPQCCAAASCEESKYYVDVLQLLLLNRTLNAKVQALSAVQTDFFQSAESRGDGAHDAEGGAAAKGSALQSVGGALKRVGSQGSVAASKTDLAIKSPDDPTRRSGKTFYQRQTDALAQLQVSLQDHAEDCGNDAQFCCYLDRLCMRLGSDVTALVRVVKGRDGAVVLSSGRYRALCGRLWLMLGILDSACFRCPYNQKYLARLVPEMEGGGEQPSDDESEVGSIGALLVRLLTELTPLAAEVMRNHQHAASTSLAPAQGSSTPPARSAPAPAKPAPSKQCSTPSIALPAAWSKFHGLFPEIPVVLSHSGAAGIDSEPPLGSQSGSCTAPIVTTAEQLQTQGTTAQASVGVLELFSAALKALVSVSSGCSEAVRSLLLVEGCEGEGPSVPKVVTWATAVLAWCGSWRCSWTRSEKGAKGGGALSPTETVYERFVFDTMLHVQSLLTHLHGSEGTAVPTADASVAVLDNLALHPSLVSSMPSGAVAYTPGAYLRQKCPLLHHLTSHGSRSVQDATPELQSCELSRLLVEILYLETAGFLVDLEETDAAINNPDDPAATPVREEKSAHSSPAASKVKASPASAGKKKTPESGAGALPIPVAELVVAAHASLLLHTLHTGRSDDNGSDRNELGQKLITANAAEDASGNRPSGVLDKLPRKGWWLCARVLKAFLNLQGQTGIMLLDNISPVLAALRAMQEHTDATAQPSALPPVPEVDESLLESPDGPAVTRDPVMMTGKKPAAAERFEAVPDWLDFSSDAVEDAAATRTSGRSKEVKATGAQQGSWEWNGYDYVWVAASESDAPAIPDAVHSKVATTTAEVCDLTQDEEELSDDIFVETDEPDARVCKLRRELPLSVDDSDGDEEFQYWGNEQTSTLQPAATTAVALLPAASSRAPLRAPRPAPHPPAVAAREVSQPEVDHGRVEEEATECSESDAGGVGGVGGGWRAKRKRMGEMLVPQTQNAPAVASEGGWRAKRKFVIK